MMGSVGREQASAICGQSRCWFVERSSFVDVLPKRRPRSTEDSALCQQLSLLSAMTYAPDVAELVPECKPYASGSEVYQLTTTVWVTRKEDEPKTGTESESTEKH